MNELEQLQDEISRLRGRLREAEECIEAIQEGRVDAFVVGARDRDRVFVLESVDGPFRIIVEQMQQGALTLSADGSTLYANARVAGLLGRERAEIIGRPFASFVAAEDRALFAALAGGDLEEPQGELRLECADGTRVPVWLGIEPPGSHGERCLLVTDLSQQKQREQLIEAGALARLVVEQAPDVVVVCDPDDLIVLASPPAHEACEGNPLWQPFGRMFPLALPRPATLAPGGRFEPAAVESPVRSLEVSLKRADGDDLPLLLCACPVRDSTGTRLGSVVTLTDIRELKHAERELKDADRRKDEFLAMLAHELRNPLAPIVSGLEVLKLSGAGQDGQSAVFRMIQRQVDQLVRLVDDLLEISRIARGKIELRKEVVELADVLEDALETSRPLIRAMRHTLEVDLPQETVLVECDGVRLSQVVANLLNNAAKYTPRGGRVALSAHAENGELVIRVRDNGYGIDPEALDRVFEMFTQTRLSSRSESGLGVGLALVRTLVEMHGGTVRAASEGRGRGSEFTVRLPLGDAALRARSGEKSPVAARPGLERILVVDDNRDSAKSLAMLLKMFNYDVHVAFDGASALDELRRFDAQAVLLDIDMPGMDGFEVARRIREHPEWRDLVLVALTGWGQDDDRARSRAAGFDQHLLKPVNTDALRTVLAAAGERPPARPDDGAGAVTH
jgi:PAS domain S-box-containing protein